jgi:hypothetical protein
VNVSIEVIPHKQQRYASCGDYWEDEHGNLQIRVSFMRDARFEQLIAHHEHHEALICLAKGISFAEIDAFDTAYEAARESGRAPCGCEITKDAEPGEDVHAPYHKAHMSASRVERQLAAMLGVDWDEYDAEVRSLA